MVTPPLKPAATYAAFVGQALKALRVAEGLKQTTLAEAACLSQPTWARIERGDLPIRLGHLRLAALALRTFPSKILEVADDAAFAAAAAGIEIRLSSAEQEKPDGTVTISLDAVALYVDAAIKEVFT